MLCFGESSNQRFFTIFFQCQTHTPAQSLSTIVLHSASNSRTYFLRAQYSGLKTYHRQRDYGTNIMSKQSDSMTARLASMDELIDNVLPNFIRPVPSRATLRAQFDRAGVRRIKTNPTAVRGGGPCYYVLADVEKLFTSRLLKGNLVSVRTTVQC